VTLAWTLKRCRRSKTRAPTLNAAQTCTVGVAFDSAGTPGPVTGQLTVTTDAESQQITLSGRAIP